MRDIETFLTALSKETVPISFSEKNSIKFSYAYALSLYKERGVFIL